LLLCVGAAFERKAGLPLLRAFLFCYKSIFFAKYLLAFLQTWNGIAFLFAKVFYRFRGLNLVELGAFVALSFSHSGATG